MGCGSRFILYTQFDRSLRFFIRCLSVFVFQYFGFDIITCYFTDAGAVARINGKVPPWLQWLVVNIPSNNVSLGYTVSPYIVKTPTVIRGKIRLHLFTHPLRLTQNKTTFIAGQGYPERHRYVFFVYEQNEKFSDDELSRFIQ